MPEGITRKARAKASRLLGYLYVENSISIASLLKLNCAIRRRRFSLRRPNRLTQVLADPVQDTVHVVDHVKQTAHLDASVADAGHGADLAVQQLPCDFKIGKGQNRPWFSLGFFMVVR
jgi:hypothetical protein